MNVKEIIFGDQARAAQSLAPADNELQGSLPIADVDYAVIKTRDGGLIGAFEVLPMNFFLQNAKERERIISNFAAWLRIAPNNIQILCLSQQVDVEQYTRRMDDYMAHEEDPQCRACIADNIRQVQDMIQDGAFTTRFFIAYQYEPYMAPGADKDVKRYEAMYQVALNARGYLARCGLAVVEPNFIDNQMVELVFGMLCKHTSPNIRLPVGFRYMLKECFTPAPEAAEPAGTESEEEPSVADRETDTEEKQNTRGRKKRGRKAEKHMAVNNKAKKKQTLRNNEYYSTQALFDDLYERSQLGGIFTHLMEKITSQQNILLAYRAIKKNKGSKTKGVNSTTIVEMGEKQPEELIAYVRKRLQNFHPHAVRRVEIPKPDGRMRPLGIPTMEDRIVQQCIKQVLEPICEAKFYKHSYGFRPNRSAHHAVARAMYLVNISKYRYVVDVDIKGFFDNVDHGKLLKQLWTLGIRDKQLLCILSKMLKAPIQGEGIPKKGVPQGGILSPLLSNVVLNELDWWIASQWEAFPQLQRYKSRPYYKGNGTLKQVYLVRYADDFKLFCKCRSDAQKIFAATTLWLKERLGLEISPEKSKIVNLKKRYSDFLGFKLKLRPKSGKWVLKSHMADKAQKKCRENIRIAIGRIGREPNQWSVMQFNAMVLGLHEYYKIATNVYLDFDRIAFDVRKTLLCRIKSHRSKTGLRSQAFQQFYGDFTGKVFNVAGLALFPINGVKTTPPMCFSPDICNYSEKGRAKIHEMQKAISPYILQQIMEHPIQGESTELNDNRISLYVAQRGKCAVCKEPLLPGEMEVHHITPKAGGGKDNYSNLALVTGDVHKLIHATDLVIIRKYFDKLKHCKLNMVKLNKFRLLAGNCKLEYR